MRDILFKAKRLDNGEWVEGSCVNASNRHFYIFTGKLDISNGYLDFEKYSVCPDTICQYTGLTDKNGNKIWENDVCDRHEQFPEIVKQHKGDWILDYSYVYKKEYGYSYCNLGFYAVDRACIKVIGNIFDNPELMERMKGGVE